MGFRNPQEKSEKHFLIEKLKDFFMKKIDSTICFYLGCHFMEPATETPTTSATTTVATV